MHKERTELNENENDMIISDKTHRVVFLGSQAVGKSSLIDQLMSSEHTNVYQQNNVEEDKEKISEGGLGGGILQQRATGALLRPCLCC